MATEQQSLQGWVPEIGREITIEQVVDLAFDYRGDVTIDFKNGAQVTGYLYNRNAKAAHPFIQLLTTQSGEDLRIFYGEIANIRFSGRDTAAGQSYEAWKARREAARSQ